MNRLGVLIPLAAWLLQPLACDAALEVRGDALLLTTSRGALTFSADNGALLALCAAGKTDTILAGGEQGLWRARFRDNTLLDASAFHAGAGERVFSAEPDAARGALRLLYRAPEIMVTVSVTATAEGADLRAEVTPRQKVLLEFSLPGRLRFAPDRALRFIGPMNGNSSVGISCSAGFFQRQPEGEPNGWRPEMVGGQGYAALYGGPLDQRPDQDPPTALSATPQAREWLGPALADRIQGAQAVVNRPPTRAQADLVLADSANGPYFSASHLGGSGFLWRLGGGVGEAERALAADMVAAAVARLTETAAPERTKLGLIALRRAPENGGWAGVSTRDWRERFSRLSAVARGRVQLVELRSPQDVLAAANAPDFVAILNPYGEWAPVTEDGGMAATVAAVGRFVRAGGSWFEVGGYPFFYAMRPLRYLQLGTTYPAGFADFFHLDNAAGGVSVYGVQPQTGEPWQGARNHDLIFIPGSINWGGDDQGGYCDRSFATYISPAETWRAPLVRLALGGSVADDLRAYCVANAITRGLKDKMSPEVLGRFRRSVLVYYGGNAREKTEGAALLPSPCLVHFADYLQGGFDKQYPDHLPPRPSFGTPEEMRAFLARCRQLGLLVMPYTNPTWWCDHPRGPTFEREGEAPLLKDLDGKPVYERYGQNDGWTVCHWHPAVQAANRKTVQQFSVDFPVDVLFEDQCGARGWQYDTNPASPTPYAYSDGLISMVAEDCRTRPLSTEGGWDRVVNYESQLCGLTWAILPAGNGPSWAGQLKSQIPPETWTVFPLAQYIAHDKAAMVHHDLGQFVTNRQILAWTLGLGFCMSDSIGAAELTRPGPRQWLLWLDRLQKSLCARYMGEPVVVFSHDRGARPTFEDDGVIRAQYGPVRLAANLGPGPRTEGGKPLAPFGFYATAPGTVAGNIQVPGESDPGGEGVSFVTEGDAAGADLWVYGPGEQQVSVPAPGGMTGEVRLSFDGSRQPLTAPVAGGAVTFRLPPVASPRQAPPAELAGKAPRDWPGEKPALGVLDLGLGVAPTWTTITPAQWEKALQDSRLGKDFGLPVRRLSNPEELSAALTAGPTRWLCIINPYGELFPASGPGKWREALTAIRSYVNNGGVWWETGGFSFYQAVSPVPGGGPGGQVTWSGEAIGPTGSGFVGIPVGGGEVEQAAEPLRVTETGRAWLGDELAARVGKATSVVNRGGTRGSDDPGHVTLVAGEQQDFIVGYRLEGWGWLWRIGGFSPDPQVALPVTVAALEHLYLSPPPPFAAGGVKYLWHARMTKMG